MRLFLSSYRLGNDPLALRRLVGEGRRAAVCMNACDTFDDRRMVWPRERTDLEGLGFEVSEVDLREHFDDGTGLREQLMSIDLLWVVGGNTFTLARAMSASGFASVGTELVASGQLAYAGYSAGVCVITPDLQGIHLMDEPHAEVPGYPLNASATALGWLPWRVVPHWSSEHQEAEAADLAVNYLLEAELPFRTLRDGHAIVVKDGETYLVGRS